jgi:hypothetical protein
LGIGESIPNKWTIAHLDATPASQESWAAIARAVIVAVAFCLAWWTWGHWADIQVDCGRELYVPLEVLRGKQVYRDFWYPYGPLAPYLEALLIHTFGKHLVVFYLFGLAITISCALLLFEIGKLLDSIAVGTAAALALLLQGFEPWAFNFIFPYAYAATLGLTFGLVAVLLAVKHIFKRSGVGLVLASVAGSLALLCKQEVGISCFLMLLFVAGFEALSAQSFRALLVRIAQCAPGVALATLIYGDLFWTLGTSFVLENWLGPPGPYFAAKYGKALYAGFGMRFIPLETIALIISAVLALRLWYWLARLCLKSRGYLWLFIIICLPLIVRVFTLSEPWSQSRVWHLTAVFYYVLIYPRGMYFIALGYLLRLLYLIYKGEGNAKITGRAAIGIFAITLAIRVMAQVTPLGYSIYYATPLFLIFIMAVSDVIRLAIGSDAGWVGKTQRRLLTVQIVSLAILIVPFGDWRTAELKTSWGRMSLSANDAKTAAWMLDFISKQKMLGKRVLIVPEAPFLYALSETEAPGRWYTLLPGFLSAEEERDYVNDLERYHPDFILVTARNYQEYGSPHFGIDFDREIMRWITAGYRIVGKVGEFPTGDHQALAMHIYSRK